MDFGVPKEVRPYEQRVGLTPAGVYALTQRGHRVYIQRDAGLEAGFTDEDYRIVGGTICYNAEEVFGRADVVLKLTRITKDEYQHLREEQTILSFLHMSVASTDLSDALQNAEITAIAYEMIENDDGQLTVLHATSQVVGRLAPIIAGHYLESTRGGTGILLSGIAGVPSAEVVIIGAGVVGSNAASAFLGLGVQVTVLDSDYHKLVELDQTFKGRVNTLMSTSYNLNRVLRFANVVVGAVLVRGQRAPIIITRELVKSMRPGTVLIDFSIDQGGCSETSRPTTHFDPVYLDEGVIHYCVPNAPARVARTASHAHTNAALPYILEIAKLGVDTAIENHSSLKRGLQVYKGELQ